MPHFKQVWRLIFPAVLFTWLLVLTMLPSGPTMMACSPAPPAATEDNPHTKYKKLLAANFAEKYLDSLPPNLKKAFAEALGAPMTASVKTMAAIPVSAAESALTAAKVVEEGAEEATPVSLFQVGLLNEPHPPAGGRSGRAQGRKGVIR